MRDSQKAEVARISQEVARSMFTQSTLFWGVDRELHARLPDTVQRHAQALLPGLAKAAIAEATPDLGEAQASVERAIRDALREEVSDLVRQASSSLLPELALGAVRNATPDVETTRAELLATAAPEMASIISGQTAKALAELVAEATARLRTAVAEALERDAARVLPDLARTAIANATPDPGHVRDNLVRDAAAALSDTVRTAVEDAAPGAVRDIADQVRSTLADTVTTAAAELLPELARAAIRSASPDPAAVREELTRHATATVAETARAAAEKAVPGMVDMASGSVLALVREAVLAEAQTTFARYTPTVISVVLPEGKPVELTADTHAVLPELLIALHARCHVLLVGPAGTGKSMLAKHAAEALGLEFQALSLGPTTPMSKVFGYYDAHGHYHDTPFRRAFEHGGVMLLDELDNGHPGLLAELNQALALGTCAFADGMVAAHADFRLVATGNTYGTGGDRQYVGRQSLDSATLDRFVVIDVPIDEGLEERLALRHAPSHPDSVWELVAMVRELRSTAQTKKLPVIISPRASIDGAKLLEAGATVDQVMQWRVLRGLSDAHRAALGQD